MKCRAPSNTILLGAKGQAGEATMAKLVDAVIANDYLGVMVWYVSIPKGLQYAVSWDGSDQAYQQSFINAMERLKPYNQWTKLMRLIKKCLKSIVHFKWTKKM